MAEMPSRAFRDRPPDRARAPERGGAPRPRWATMAAMDDYLEVNRLNWDERATVHAASAEYGFDRFVTDPEHLSDVVRFDRPLLGDVTGLTGIHLQCHIGTDTLSLARLGARMTGLDLSPVSLEQARRLATDAGADVDYVEADTYSAPQALGGPHLRPRLHRHRGAVLAARHRPVGRRRRRPARARRPAVRPRGPPDDVGRRRDASPTRLTLGYAYFETPEPFDLEEAGTYVENDHEFVNTRQLSWNHGIGEILTALLAPRVRGHRVRRAPQRALGRPAGADGPRRRPRRVAPGRRGGAAAAVATRCRRASPGRR